MTKRLLLLVSALVLMSLGACFKETPEVEGFYLPEGDAERGQQVFIDFRCYECHSIADVDLPERQFTPEFVVALGGKVRKVENYGQLMTAVVYPNHALSKQYLAQLEVAGKTAEASPMVNFTDAMTVRELVDLTEFLHGHYSRLMPQYYRGRHHEMP